MNMKDKLYRTRNNKACFYCGATPGKDRLTIEHVLPKSLFVNTKHKNRLLALACQACNTQRGDFIAGYDNLFKTLMNNDNPARRLTVARKYLRRMKKFLGKNSMEYRNVFLEVSEIISLFLGDCPLTFATPVIVYKQGDS